MDKRYSDARNGQPPFRLKPANSRKSVSRSAIRAFDLLEYFGEVKRPVRAIEISKALDLHPSSTNQLLKTLLEAAHLTFDARSKTYLPAPRLRGFGKWMMDCYGNGDRILALLHGVHEAFGGVATLTTPNDLFMQILEMVGSLPETSQATRGYQVSVFGSAAVGDAYLSTLSDREVTRLTRRARIPRESKLEVLRRVSRARSTGIAEGFVLGGGLYSLATPLPLHYAPVPLVIAVACSGKLSACSGQEMDRLMRDVISKWTYSFQETGATF